jgi:hypothetical protein
MAHPIHTYIAFLLRIGEFPGSYLGQSGLLWLKFMVDFLSPSRNIGVESKNRPQFPCPLWAPLGVGEGGQPEKLRTDLRLSR